MLSGQSNSLGFLKSPLPENRFYIALGFGLTKGEVGEFASVLKGEEAKLEEKRRNYRSRIRGRRVVEIYGKARRERKGGEAEGRIGDGNKDKEVFAFGVELSQRAGTENFPWFSAALCP